MGSTGEIFDGKLTKAKVDAIIKSVVFMPPEQIRLYLLAKDEQIVRTITTREGLRDKVKELLLKLYTPIE